MKLEERESPQGHRGQVWSVAWNSKPCHHAQHMLASTGDDAMTIVWHCIDDKWEKFQALCDVEGRSLRAVAWHPEGRTLAVGGCGTKVNFWRHDEDTQAFTLNENIPNFHGDKVKSISWNEEGSLLLCCSDCGQISIVKEGTRGYIIVCRVSLEESTPLSRGRWIPCKKQNEFVVAGSLGIKTFELSENNQGVLEACASPDISCSNNLQGYFLYHKKVADLHYSYA